VQSALAAKKKSKCRACGLPFQIGENVIRLRLRKSFRAPCTTCAHKLLGVKWFHPACVPPDINKAMGYDPNVAHVAAPDPHQVAPPPKPQSAADAGLGALLAIENALKRRVAENPALQKSEELAATLKTYNGCKARALRPGTDAEGVVALKMALKRALDLVF
jgi:hypothetical protein